MKRKTVPKKIRNTIYNDLYIETSKLVRETNRRLERLERGVDLNKAVYNPKTKRFERKGTYTIVTDTGKRITMKPTKIVRYDTESWAGKKLREKISTIKGATISGKKVKLSTKLSISDLKAVKKAASNFLKSKTSTNKGIKEVENRIKNTIKETVEDEDIELSSQEVNTLYNFFEDKDFNYITKYIDPSELMVILNEVASEGGTSDDFLRRIENYIYSDSLYKDDDLVEALENIYNKYIGS